MALITIIFSIFLSLTAQAWVSAAAKIGKYETTRYQSSNPAVFLNPVRATNQGSTEECYLFAFVSSIELANQNGWNRAGESLISSEILFLNKLEQWAHDVWTFQLPLDQGFYFERGGDVHHAMKLSVDRGLYPQKVFKPIRPLEFWNTELLYKEVRQIVREEKISVARANNQQEFAQLYQQAMLRLKLRLYQDAGVVPDRFSYDSKWITPQTFENRVGIKRNSFIHYLYPAGRWDMGDPWDLRRTLLNLVSTFNGQFRHGQTSWKRIWSYVIDSLDRGMPTMFSLKWGQSYHVLVAEGYEYDSKGQVVSIKMKNTWGSDFGANGSAVFSPYDLQKVTSGVWGFTAPTSF